ncbi:unnamed protein product [Vitrella brassicaformis CCMP3155]|uniref:Pantothenate kinase n=1 Tax=Vitrella brassicaformis (strain CCMP3155) TaxID=1169540 RepID=A0A0G4FER6_VITBC|nr:unnamed protein product [Vitrella brassicaformis CCMP3155]|mmetsp:Transcript_52927/g.133022  ORF Transcript_52927/g.133022 Transcript_52927/m.133022 type:complete len:451 (+) Transcript_52927:7585-8937(+)|eukprot:CEM11684.1 unnamed protein product [Vitrella brassicaformis CCMP3155]
MRSSESSAPPLTPALAGAPKIGLDVGGSLAKVVFSSTGETHNQSEGLSPPDDHLELDLGDGRTLRFIHFQTKQMGDLITFLRDVVGVRPGQALEVTGGGAFKYQDLLSKKLGVQIHKNDEMQSLMNGLSFLIRQHSHSTRRMQGSETSASSSRGFGSRGRPATDSIVFRFDVTSRTRVPVDLEENVYPLLVVNIGSGVSILKATAPDKFLRVTGTCIGGGTVLGLARLLFNASSFEEVVRLSEKGEDVLDLKVRDLFGERSGSRVLPGDTLASSFGKIYALNTCVSATELRGSLRKEDIARSLIHMVSYNLGYIAYLIGSVHRVRRVFFAGKYINDRPLTMQSITEGVNFYARHYAEAWHRAAQPHDRARAQAEPHAENRPAPTALSPPAASATRQHEAQEGHDASTEGSPTMGTAADLADDLGSPPEPFDVLFLRHDGYLGCLGACGII